jgi:hypothetical protein
MKPSILRLDFLYKPIPSRLPQGKSEQVEKLRLAILDAHQKAVEKGDPVYIDPVTQRSVMTSAFLASRATCCTSGCRHCPYEC